MTVLRRRACCCGPGEDCLEFWRRCVGIGPARISARFYVRNLVQIYALCDDLTPTTQLMSSLRTTVEMSGAGRYEANGANLVDCALALVGDGVAQYEYKSSTQVEPFNVPCPTFAPCFEQTGYFAGIVTGGVRFGLPQINDSRLSVYLSFLGAPTSTIVLRSVGVCGNSFATFQYTGSAEAYAFGKPGECTIDPQTAAGQVSFGDFVQGPLVFQSYQQQYVNTDPSMGATGFIVIENDASVQFQVGG